MKLKKTAQLGWFVGSCRSFLMAPIGVKDSFTEIEQHAEQKLSFLLM